LLILVRRGALRPNVEMTAGLAVALEMKMRVRRV
jgi:hypothetical protein